MCGRFTQSLPLDWIEAWLAVDEVDPACAELAVPRYNIAPSQRVLVALRERRGRVLTAATWGLRGGRESDGARPINARAESLATHPRFRSAFEGARCVVPATGFFEWQVLAGSHHKRPWYFSSPDSAKPLLLLAGICARRGHETTCAIVTTRPSAVVAPVHDRMPLVLAAEDVSCWLGDSPLAASRLLGAVPARSLVGHAVGVAVNDVKRDDVTLIKATP